MPPTMPIIFFGFFLFLFFGRRRTVPIVVFFFLFRRVIVWFAMRVFGMGEPGNVTRALRGEKIGTLVTADK